MKTPSAKKLPSGSWFCRVRVNGEDICVTRQTEKEAIAEAMAIKAGLKAPEPKASTLTLDEAIGRYIDDRRAVLSPSTIRGYNTIRSARFQSLSCKRIGAITKAQWQSAVSAEARRLSAKTVENSWRFVESVLRFCGVEPPQGIRLPAKMAGQKEYLTPEQIPIFLEAAKGTPIELAALFGLHSLRISEVLDMKRSDIDLDAQIIHVRGAAVLGEEHRLIHKAQNKSAASRRDIPILIPRLAELLSAASDGYLVPLHPNTVVRKINAVCRSSSLPEVGSHGLRHSFASLCYHLGIPAKIAMQLGGWSDMQTMLRIYTHISQRDIGARVEDLRSFFQTKNGNENANAAQQTIEPQAL